MKSIVIEQRIPIFIGPTIVSHNLNYPLWHLVDVLLPLFAKTYTYASLRETIHSSNHVWCAYENGKCIGCALMTDIGSHGGLYMILFGIRKSAQGRGVGKYLLDNIIRWSHRKRYRFIYLQTEHNNIKAIRMYEKAGFRKGLHTLIYYEALPQCGSDVVSMVLFLA